MQPPEAAVNQSAGASPYAPEQMRQPDWLTLLLLFAAGIAIRLESLASKPFWFDECFSVEVARISWPNFLHLLWWREANMSLYYVLLRIWLSLAPQSGQGAGSRICAIGRVSSKAPWSAHSNS